VQNDEEKMEDTTRSALVNAGINVDSALERFLDDEEMYFEFLLQFLDENGLPALQKTVASGDVKSAFDAAHTIKGVCANLSIDAMSDIVEPMVEVLRAGSMEGVASELQRLTDTYDVVSDAIRRYCS
jgi:HPt (histidine-containing phosphotransfer) domain-containing protein